MGESINLFQTNEQLPSAQSNYVDGQLKAIFFASADSFYKVVLVEITATDLDWFDSEIVVTGSFGDLIEENHYHFEGRLVQHQKYGNQFQAIKYSAQLANTEEGVIKYLAGETFPGIGLKTAEKIVRVLGETALNQIAANPDVLKEVGISAKQSQIITANLAINDDLEQIIVGLNSYGFSSQMATKIFQKYHEDTLTIISENPYQLAEDIDGISFKRADDIAIKMGLAPDSSQRIKAGLLYAINEICNQNGDTYTDTDQLMMRATAILDTDANPITGDVLASALVELAKENKIVGEDQRIYLASLYRSEFQIAEHLNRIINNREEEDFKDRVIKDHIKAVEKQLAITYDESQINAIIKAIKSPVFLLTGGPGTGKTTIINGIVNTYARMHGYSLDVNQYKDESFPIVLAAPTGRAAKHMADSTGLIASTIHRLLGLTVGNTDISMVKDITGKLLIVDEMSMVDTYLFRLLIRAVPNDMKIVFVGDKDQLPSVGPGQVFFDLLSSKRIASLQLTQIYRQESESSIIKLAHEIKNGRLPADFTEHQADRSFIACNESQIPSVIKQVVSRAQQKQFDLMEVQVLAPMYRGQAGINNLNNVAQTVWLADKQTAKTKKVQINNHEYQIGDKVLQLVNNPEQNVFNGDLGIIVGMDYSKNQAEPNKIIIDFEQTEVTYERSEWNQFTLAYCTSIHKAQGSEFKMVILPMTNGYSRMLQRNLLYTAVTRASDFLIMIGSQQAFNHCVQVESATRKTSLKQRIEETIKEEQPAKNQVNLTVPNNDLNNQPNIELNNHKQTEIINNGRLTATLIDQKTIDPMIGMGEVTPIDFLN